MVESEGIGTITATHMYENAGVYSIELEVVEGDGTAVTKTIMVVVYDPSAGFVTGGGWINSPAGAYTPDPDLVGIATFGFVSKYKKGADVPTGNTVFQFHVVDMIFKSSSYDWLVIAGARAQFKGEGTINGVSGYRFLLTAIDGALPGGSGVDKFRIKIWRISDGQIIYDNKLGESDDIDQTDPQEIGGGSIVIHKDK